MTVLDFPPAPVVVPGKRRWWAPGAVSLAVGRDATVLGVMAHTADHIPRHVGACSFRISGLSGNAAVRMTRPFRYSSAYWQMAER